MQRENIYAFLQRFEDNTHTDDEHEQFIDWLRTAGLPEVEDVADRYREVIEKKKGQETVNLRLVSAVEATLNEWEQKKAADAMGKNEGNKHEGNKPAGGMIRKLPLYKRSSVRVAAAVLVILSCTWIYYFLRPAKQMAVAKQETKASAGDVLPGSNKAVLVRSDGSEVVLDSNSKGRMIPEKNGQKIVDKGGALSYLDKGQGIPSAEVMYNTVRVPRKGQYQLVLADGTRVWLNAESSLTYPTAFNGDQRQVEVTGEAYFEVAKDAERPFHVIHRGLDVQVLGTAFNVNSYEDEVDAKITLLEGSVSVSSSDRGPGIPVVRLKPGQQARQRADGRLTVLNNADTEEAIAWKEGRFAFKDADIKDIMRQLKRWYDIEVEYHGKTDDRFFTADISRNKNLSSVIKILELSNIHCMIDHQKLIVTP